MAQRTIFVIDDEQDNLDYLRAIIEEAGHAVETFSDGAVALERMGAAAPDLVFLDVQMPNINGFQVLKGIRDNEAVAATPVVLLSAIGAVTGVDYDPEIIESQYGVRPNAFLPKPIQPDEVTRKITELLEGKD